MQSAAIAEFIPGQHIVIEAGVILKSYSRVTREARSLGRHAGAGECQMPGINRLDTYPHITTSPQAKRHKLSLLFTAGASRLPLAPKRVIKQQNSGPKPWFEVPKVCCDPKGMVFTHFWGIWGHLGALQQRYLVKPPISRTLGLWKIFTLPFFQPTRCNFFKFLQFSTPRGTPRRCGKLLKNLIL